jgi:hypothetical protein
MSVDQVYDLLGEPLNEKVNKRSIDSDSGKVTIDGRFFTVVRGEIFLSDAKFAHLDITGSMWRVTPSIDWEVHDTAEWKVLSTVHHQPYYP